MDLGDPRVGAGDVPGAEPAGADDLGRQAVAVELVGERDQLGDRGLRLLHPQLAVWLEHAVPLVAERAAQLQPRRPLDPLREGEGGVEATDARPVQADVELDQNADLGPGRDGGVRELIRVDLALDQNGDIGEPCKAGKLGGLDRADDLVADEDLREPGGDHRRCFRDGRGGEPDRARVDLHLTEYRALVDLRVGP